MAMTVRNFRTKDESETYEIRQSVIVRGDSRRIGAWKVVCSTSYAAMTAAECRKLAEWLSNAASVLDEKNGGGIE